MLIVSEKPVSLDNPLFMFNQSVGAVAFNYESNLLSASSGKHILTWALPSGELISDIEISKIKAGFVDHFFYGIGLAYTVDDILIVAGSDGYLQYIDPLIGKLLGSSEELVKQAFHIAMNLEGTELAMATCGVYQERDGEPKSEKKIRLWVIYP